MAFALRLFAVAACLLVLVGCSSQSRYVEEPLDYPVAHKVDHVDNYHGTEVPDPYRWLEDPDSPESRAWIEAENEITFKWLGEITEREGIKERLSELWNYERYGLPFKRGGRYFYSKNNGLQNQSVIYTVRSLDDEPKVLLDPNKLSDDGTIALSGYSISEDGKLMAYGLSEGGSDWQEWYVRDIETGKDLVDHIKWIKFSGASWTKDGKGFYYGRFAEPKEGDELQQRNAGQQVYYHRLGTPQAADLLIFEQPDHPDWFVSQDVTDDGRYLILSIRSPREHTNQFYYIDLSKGGYEVVKLIDKFEAQYGFIDNDGPVFWFMTDLDAPRYRVVAVNVEQPEKANWKEVVPQQAETLQGANVVNNMFVVDYLKDARSQVKILDLNGKFVREVEFPAICTAGGFGGRMTDTETFYTFHTFNTAPTIYRYDMVTGKSSVFRAPDVKFKSKNFEVKQVFYKSKDGTKVPMFIAHKKGLKLNGKNPVYLYGYGGFNVTMTPYFSVTLLTWMEMGGVYAMPCIRGGGEYGKDWHEAGCKLEKQNVFDDFIAAAEWLIDNKYTCTSKLSIGGGSNGGLLVGACMTQRPELFGAVIAEVGVMDMLRFQEFTIGYAWVSDYGSSADPEEFKALYAYSPLHNIKKGTEYPATLLITADHDDRVVPAHSFKYAATLQEAQAGDAPVIIRIETKAGHGAGKPTAKRIEEAADKWGFLVRALKM